MKTILKFEELLMFMLGMYLFSQLQLSWWWFVGLLLTPDVGMLGYIVNTKVGAYSYNLFHHKGLAILIYFLGLYLQQDVLKLIGVILFSHASFDRVFGYGLKYVDHFKNTHLGKL
ncbi:hypothetical protein PK35_16430 [Tamlana nanhaiensis]|uniref:DUF4260 domain-containing protein n=1 Tax=Neotamlana nanhaiensis TaxID=1382798 RepID=A0A0D7VW13_9FLAO|nr:DUF4260 domain-containing protein [Tamlana nanhaiensis]KJD31070.1 hypothetical protein PK35_16430 [Tamlana nanhaiensis]